jgi:Cu/Ag efflux protein CusF
MKRAVISIAFLLSGYMTWAQTPTVNTSAPSATESATTTSDMADGEVRKVDRENKKITLKHGAIKNLDMPGMTMVFQVKDMAMLDKVKAGDKIRFKAELAGSSIVLTDIAPAN